MELVQAQPCLQSNARSLGELFLLLLFCKQMSADTDACSHVCQHMCVSESSSIAFSLIYPDRVSELNQEFANTTSQAVEPAPRILHVYFLELQEYRRTPILTHNFPLSGKCFNY